jgi:uncharacterized protein YndB with AHSA1/START domain
MGSPGMTMDRLARLASDGQMIPAAPILASRSITIDAPLDKVWHLLTTVSEWEQWYSYLKNAKLDGPFAVGTRVSYGGLFKHDLRIAKFVQQEMVMIYGKLAGFSGITRWDFRKLGENSTQVTFTESSEGPLLGLLYSNKRLETHLQNWLEALKREAERGSRTRDHSHSIVAGGFPEMS